MLILVRCLLSCSNIGEAFYRLGQLASMCLVCGGGGFHVLVFEYINGRDVADIIALPEEVSDLEARSIIDKVRHD